MPLTDAQWARIEPLLPDRTPKRGGRWPDHREVIDAIACKFQTGPQWVHLPERYGNWWGVCNRLRMWAVDGYVGAGFHRTGGPGRCGREPRLGCLGRLYDRAGPPARCRGPQKGAPAGEPGDHAIGRSRGGLTTKIHLAFDARCRPLAFVLTAGQAGDAPAFPEVMARLRAPVGEGNPAPGRIWSSPTRRTPPAPSANACASAASGP
ncbi:IS5 family transposase [Streptomyces koyangensis]|uniref:IS5 family transposase n=1 Tax=Streptomyces koyangensis TaxID=188770 RepID=UPI003656968A